MPRHASKKREETESSDGYDPEEDADDRADDDSDDDMKKSKRRQRSSPIRPHKRGAIAQGTPSRMKLQESSFNLETSQKMTETDNTVKNEDSEDLNSKPVPLTVRKNKRKRKTYKVNEKEEALPTSARKTERGGYAHKSSSKAKISMANSGNTPWNLGKNRSSADKAKIAAGVRARNRARLLEKLERLNMTEEEYLKKKREVKYIRERIRRAKIANAKHQQKELQAELDATLKEMDEQAQEEEQEKTEV
jgi:hypothetical protein